MKKHRRFLLVLSMAAQLVSYVGAVAMLFKKKKGTAGFLAALGFIGTLIAAATLDSVPDKSKTKLNKAADILRDDIETAKRIHEEQQTEEQIMAENGAQDPDDGALYNSVTQALDEINVCDDADADCDTIEVLPEKDAAKADDLEKIQRAIDILKNAGTASDEESGDIGELIDNELTRM